VKSPAVTWYPSFWRYSWSCKVFKLVYGRNVGQKQRSTCCPILSYWPVPVWLGKDLHCWCQYIRGAQFLIYSANYVLFPQNSSAIYREVNDFCIFGDGSFHTQKIVAGFPYVFLYGTQENSRLNYLFALLAFYVIFLRPWDNVDPHHRIYTKYLLSRRMHPYWTQE